MMRWGIRQCVGWLAFVSLILLLACLTWSDQQAGDVRTQTFDRNPGWDGRNNRAAPAEPQRVNQNFGYDPVRQRIGGEFWQTLKPAWYGVSVGDKSFDDALSASGSLIVEESASGSGWQNSANVFVGWFNADERSLLWRPRDFVGFRLQAAHDPDGALVEISYGTSKWQADGAFVNKAGGGQQKLVRDLTEADLLNIAPDGRAHQWSLRYDPQGNNGKGEIIFIFDGAESRLGVGEDLRRIGAKFTHFGVFTPRIPGRRMILWFDDIALEGRTYDFSSDPLWQGAGNRVRFANSDLYAYNNFGYSPTAHAGGKPGELGGRFMSCDPHEQEFKAFYGDRIGRLTMNHRLVARGRFFADEFSIDSTFGLGWFNASEQGWPIKNFVGVYFDSLSSTGRIVMPLWGTSQGTRDRSSEYVTFEPGKPYEWTLDYDPAAAGGRGAITFAIGDQRVTTPLADGDRQVGAAFDRFGVFNMQWANSKWCDVYLDDLTYTVGQGEKAGNP
jgi:hypothetical protein